MLLEILLSDLKSLISELRPHDFGPAVFWLLWLLALARNLKGIDRRDEISMVTYCVFGMALGVVIIIVLPAQYGSDMNPQSKLLAFVIFLLAPSLRWLVVRNTSDVEAALDVASKKKSK